MATDAERLTAINVQIDALIASPEVDYTEGEVTVKASQKLSQLMKLRDALTTNATPDLELLTFDATQIT